MAEKENPKGTDAKEDAKSKKALVACGHENKHYHPPKELKDARLFCTLEKGHSPVRVERTGPKGEDLSTYEVVHSAPYQRLKGGVLVDDIAYWSDAAGIAPKK